VRGYVLLGSVLRVLVGMNAVGVSQMGVVGGLLMLASFVVFGGFMVVPRGVRTRRRYEASRKCSWIDDRR